MECGHRVTATLRDVLRQCNYGGDEMMDYGRATVTCDQETLGCCLDLRRFIVRGLCSGNPSLDWGGDPSPLQPLQLLF